MRVTKTKWIELTWLHWFFTRWSLKWGWGCIWVHNSLSYDNSRLFFLYFWYHSLSPSCIFYDAALPFVRRGQDFLFYLFSLLSLWLLWMIILRKRLYTCLAFIVFLLIVLRHKYLFILVGSSNYHGIYFKFPFILEPFFEILFFLFFSGFSY